MPFECPQDVANDYEKLFNTNVELRDVIIYAGNNNRAIYAHSFVLRTRSQYFRTAFSMESFDKRDGNFVFNIPNIPFQLFNMILRFIYCGKIDLEELQGPDILNLLIAVNEIRIQTLTNYIQEYLIKNKEGYVQQNSIEILEKFYQNNAFTDLQNFCIKKICEDPERLFNSNRFTSLKAPLLELLFSNDNFSLDEIIWDNVIRWCQAQHPNISQDPKQWNNDETTTMARTIHRFIRLIRFCHIPSEVFAIKVFPFKEIIPNNLVNDMVQFHMTQNQQLNSDRRPLRSNIDSVIINKNHIATFSNWIYRENKSYGYIPYKFNLLYRASRDSNAAEVFHRKCDNKGATLVIVKIANSDQIVGGYSPLSWDSSGERRYSNDSFVFSFANRNDLQSARVGYCRTGTRRILFFQPFPIRYPSIYCCPFNGPAFGDGGDLGYFNGAWYRNQDYSYPDIGIPFGDFNMNDYEVFQVVGR